MEIGKLSNKILEEIVFKNILHKRPEVLVRPGIGEDCAVIDFEDKVCVMSTDPITGAVKDIGSLSIHITCNDIASSGVEPIGIMMTILAPVGTREKDFAYVMRDANEAAASVDVEIIGGHSEITDAVNRMVITTTAIGIQDKKDLITSKGAQIGDIVIMTKHAGLEGISIIASDLEEDLHGRVAQETIDTAKSFAKDISVVPEGVLAGKIGVSSMHDVTEGGLLGALWELAEASGVGIEIDLDKVPIRKETREICDVLSINPYKLISSGVMVMAVEEGKKQLLLKELSDRGIKASQIGKITEKDRTYIYNGQEKPLEVPGTDELYKVI